MTHQPGVYLPLRALFLVILVMQKRCQIDDNYGIFLLK